MDEFIAIIKLFAGNFAPRGWMFCNGQLLSIVQYNALFSLLGTTYGGDGRTTFALPDLRSRVPVGAVPGVPAANLTPISLGEIGGKQTHALTMSEMPAHSHMVAASSKNATAGVVQDSSFATPGYLQGREFTATLGFNTATPDVTLHPLSIQNTGGTMPHDNMQPYIGLNYIICVEGIYPPRP